MGCFQRHPICSGRQTRCQKGCKPLAVMGWAPVRFLLRGCVRAGWRHRETTPCAEKGKLGAQDYNEPQNRASLQTIARADVLTRFPLTRRQTKGRACEVGAMRRCCSWAPGRRGKTEEAKMCRAARRWMHGCRCFHEAAAEEQRRMPQRARALMCRTYC